MTGNAEQRNAAPTVTSYERLGLARWLRTTLYTARFRADFGYSLFITIAFFGFALATVAQIPIIVTPFVLPLIVSGLLIGPIVVFILGILGNRPGYAAAPAIVVLVIVGLRYAIV